MKQNDITAYLNNLIAESPEVLDDIKMPDVEAVQEPGEEADMVTWKLGNPAGPVGGPIVNPGNEPYGTDAYKARQEEFNHAEASMRYNNIMANGLWGRVKSGAGKAWSAVRNNPKKSAAIGVGSVGALGGSYYLGKRRAARANPVSSSFRRNPIMANYFQNLVMAEGEEPGMFKKGWEATKSGASKAWNAVKNNPKKSAAIGVGGAAALGGAFYAGRRSNKTQSMAEPGFYNTVTAAEFVAAYDVTANEITAFSEQAYLNLIEAADYAQQTGDISYVNAVLADIQEAIDANEDQADNIREAAAVSEGSASDAAEALADYHDEKAQDLAEATDEVLASLYYSDLLQ